MYTKKGRHIAHSPIVRTLEIGTIGKLHHIFGRQFQGKNSLELRINFFLFETFAYMSS